MSPELWQRVKPLFDAASEMDAAERGPYVVRMCAGDDELRRELERLLEQLDAESSIGGKLPRDIFLPHEPPPSGPTLLPGELLAGRFEILRFVDKGGMGEVYEASDREFGGSVALKTLRPALVHDEVSLNRFKREVLLAKRVGHKNLCRIFDGGWHRAGGKEIAFLTMEFLRGRTLAAHLTDLKVRTGAEALPVLRQIAEGLVALHEAAIIHRDLKPGNVILVPAKNSPARAVITDFGLARLVDQKNEEARVTHTPGFPIGTPEYMAPEQLAGEKDTDLGPYSDVYAFGTVAYEMLCGRLPFTAASAGLLTVQKLTTEPPRPTAIIPEITTGWEKFILRCLEREPGERIQTAAELLQWLEELETEPQPERSLLTTVGGNQAVVPVRTKDLPSSPTQPIDALKHEIIPIEEPLPPRAVPRWAAALAVAAGLVIGVLALLQWPPVRTPLLRSLCVQFPGTAMFCELPKDIDVAVLPFEIKGGSPDEQALAKGIRRFVNDRLDSLYPDKERSCVHVRAVSAGEAEKLALRGTIEVSGASVRLDARLAEADTGLLLRSNQATGSLNDAQFLNVGLSARLAGTFDFELSNPPKAPQTAAAFHAYLKGLGYLENGESEKAAEAFDQALSSDFSYAPAQVGLGDAYRQLWESTHDESMSRRARNAYDRAVGLDSKLDTALAGLGRLELMAGNTTAALHHLARALELDPFGYSNQTALAEAYESAGDEAKAIEVLEHAIELRPKCYRAYNVLAGLYNRQARYRESQQQLMTVVRLTPRNAAAYLNLAVVYLSQGLYYDAAEISAKAIEYGKYPVAYSYLGRSYQYLGCNIDALLNLQYATTFEELGQVWLHLGEGYEAIGGRAAEARHAFESAAAAYKRALNESPDSVSDRSGLSLSLARTAEPSQALIEIKRALELGPQNNQTLFQAAIVYELLGKRDEALRLLESSFKGGLPAFAPEQQAALADLRADRRYQSLLLKFNLDPTKEPGSTTLRGRPPGCPNWSVPGKGFREAPPSNS